MAFPKITWNDGAGNVGTVLFQLPPTSKPYVWKRPLRTDVYSTAGVRESSWLRTDELLAIVMNYLTVAGDRDDVADFDAFMDYAMQGGAFNYFPDADIDQSDIYALDPSNTDWKPEFASFQLFKFTLTFRKEVQG